MRGETHTDELREGEDRKGDARKGAGASRGADVRERRMDEFEGYVQAFIRYLAGVRNLSPNTVRAYEGDLDAYCSWLRREGADPLEITHRELRRWLAEQARAKYTASSIDRRLSAVRDLYRWLVREGITDKDCAAAVLSPKKAKTLPRTMDAASVEKLLASCDVKTPEGLRDRCFLELLAATGSRISEAAGLDVADIDVARRQVRLFGKGSKERIVPLYEAAIETAQAYIDTARPDLLAHAKEPGKAGDALYISTRGNRMSADALRTVFERHVRLAGLDPTLTPHAMRHTYATELLANGADMRSVQELLGHANLATTQIYTHLSIERLKDATRQAHPRAE